MNQKIKNTSKTFVIIWKISQWDQIVCNIYLEMNYSANACNLTEYLLFSHWYDIILCCTPKLWVVVPQTLPQLSYMTVCDWLPVDFT